MRPRAVPEKVEQAHITRTLRLLKFEVFVIGHPSPNDGRTFRGTGQTPGIPDLIGFSPARALPPATRAVRDLLWVEAKSTAGRLRPEQAFFRELVVSMACGQVHHVVGTLDAVIAWLIETGWAARDQFSHYRQPTEVRL